MSNPSSDEVKEELDAQGPGHELVQVAANTVACGSRPQATSDQEWAQELREIRVRRERKLDFKTDVAVRRLERLERGKLLAVGRRAGSQPRRGPCGQDQSREVDC